MIVRFDPKTSKFQSWPIPGGGNIVRNTHARRQVRSGKQLGEHRHVSDN
jgi:hypothetical protein